MSRQHKGFMTFMDERSTFDQFMARMARKWIGDWINSAKENGWDMSSVRQFIRRLENRTGLDEARARDLIKLLGIEIS